MKCLHLPAEAMFLQAINEVWGKVMFSQVFIYPWGGWLPSMHHRSHDQGVCIGGWWVDPRRTGKAGGTHSTGMLPCLSDFYMIFEGGKKDMARPHPISHRLLSSFV